MKKSNRREKKKFSVKKMLFFHPAKRVKKSICQRKSIMRHYATPERGIMGFIPPARAAVTARGSGELSDRRPEGGHRGPRGDIKPMITSEWCGVMALVHSRASGVR
jgi:hypothetical protein